MAVLSLRCMLAMSMVAGSATLWAASSMLTDANVLIVEPSSAVTQQELVSGAVILPLINAIGVSGGSVSLPPPTQSFGGIGQIRIGTESIERDLAQVVSRGGLQEASFTIIGNRDQVISVTVPPSISLSRLSGDGEVAFDPVTSLAGGGRLLASADGAGALEFDVGGKVEPSPGAIAGDYAGVLRVTVQYN